MGQLTMDRDTVVAKLRFYRPSQSRLRQMPAARLQQAARAFAAQEVALNKSRSAGNILRHIFYDWSREMAPRRRMIAIAGLALQGWAFWALWSGSLIWPVMWPSTRFLHFAVWLLYMPGYCMVNVMLTSEFLHKTQLESDQTAARRIQQTLHPDTLPQPSGYQLLVCRPS